VFSPRLNRLVTHHLIRNKFLRKVSPWINFLARRHREYALESVQKTTRMCFPYPKQSAKRTVLSFFFGGEKEKAAAGAANIEDELCAWAPNYIFFCACRQQADRRLERVSEKHLTQCHCVCSSLSAIGTWPCIIHARALSLAHHLETKKRPAELSKAPLNLDRTRIRPVGMARISPTRARERTSVNTQLELWPENNIALGARTFFQLALFVCLRETKKSGYAVIEFSIARAKSDRGSDFVLSECFLPNREHPAPV
jgi:hypothetical protein